MHSAKLTDSHTAYQILPDSLPFLPEMLGESGFESAHKTAAVFHLFFKIASVVVYLFCPLFSSSFVLSTISICDVA